MLIFFLIYRLWIPSQRNTVFNGHKNMDACPKILNVFACTITSMWHLYSSWGKKLERMGLNEMLIYKPRKQRNTSNCIVD